ncbi:MAG TPA: aldo/keto reductase [Bacilli bacterium]
MKYLKIPNSNLTVSEIALGCMRLSELNLEEAERLILSAVASGINFFDHADIYGGGKSEAIFGEILKRNPDLRKEIIIQSKCGIREGYYDSSLEHILASVDASLERLNTNYLDVLLIHRPDALTDFEEVARAFKKLREDKKVRYFGVSNMNSVQIEILQKYLPNKLIFNQLQFNLVHSLMIDEILNVNMKNDAAINRAAGILDYMRLHDITMQAWSPLQISLQEGTYLNHPDYPKLNAKLEEIGKKYQLTPAATAIAWILRHPANIQVIVGTTKLSHLQELVKASGIELTRKEWYELYLSADKFLP